MHYYNPADNYSQSIEVVYGSKILNEDFSLSTSYFTRAASISIGVALFGLAAVAGLIFGLFCRYFFTFCECRPRPVKYDPITHAMIGLEGAEGAIIEEDDADYDDEEEDDEYHFNHLRNYDLYQTYPCNRYRLINSLFLVLFLVASICFDQFFLVGRTSASKGVETIQNNLVAIDTIVFSVQNDSSILMNYGSTLDAEYTNAKTSCPLVNNPTIATYLNDYNANVQSLNSYVSPLSSNINSINQYFDYYAQGSFLFIFWGILLITFSLIFVFLICEKRFGLQLMTGVGIVLEILFILLGIIFLMFVIVFGDLCESPTFNTLNSIPQGNNLQEIANYYATCQGNTTIQVDLQNANGYVNQMYTALHTLSSSIPCKNDANLLLMETTVVHINDTLNELKVTIECPKIQMIWFQLLNDGVCTQFYSGIFYIWGAQILTCLFFFITLVLVTLNYQFYPKYPSAKENLYQNKPGNQVAMNQRVRSSSNDSYFHVELPGRGNADDIVATNDVNDDDEYV